MSSKTSSKVIGLAVERGWVRYRKRLVLEWANLRDDGLERFRKRVVAGRFPYEQDAFLLNYRDALRRVWPSSKPIEEKQALVNDVLHDSVVKYGEVAFIAPITVGRLTAAPDRLLSQLALALIENWRDFGMCENPECGIPYFLAKRKTQKYCERGSCTDYAQREYALKYWRTKGSKRRARQSV